MGLPILNNTIQSDYSIPLSLTKYANYETGMYERSPFAAQPQKAKRKNITFREIETHRNKNIQGKIFYRNERYFWVRSILYELCKMAISPPTHNPRT